MYDFSDYVSDKETFWDVLMSNNVYQCIYQWLVLVILIAILIIAVLCLKELKGGGVASSKTMGGQVINDVGAQKVVFCKNCGKQSNASMKVCQHCGTKRV